MRSLVWTCTTAAVLVASPCAEARRSMLPDGMTFYNGDFAGWKQVAPGYTTIDFTGFQHGTTIYDQYADLGVLFTSPGPPKIAYVPSALLQDGWGVDANWHHLELTFLMPMYAVAWHHGPYFMEVYNGDELIATTPFATLPSPGQKFGGVTSTIPFDRVRIRTAGLVGGQVYIDNIYFAAATIPAPGAALLMGGLLHTPGRRRRDRARRPVRARRRARVAVVKAGTTTNGMKRTAGRTCHSGQPPLSLESAAVPALRSTRDS